MGKKRRQNRQKPQGQQQKQQQRQDRGDYRKQRNKAKYHGTSGFKQDLEILLQQLAPLNLTIQDVKPDGNCLFRCFSLQLFGTQEEFSTIRHEICDYIEANRDNFEPFIEDDVPWEEYCSTIRKDKEWGSNIELQAGSMRYQANITIFQANEPRWDINNFPDNSKRFYFSYHDNSHYASVEPMNQMNDINFGKTVQPYKPVQKKPDAVIVNQTNNEIPSKDEELVMTATGITNLKLIRDTMDTFAGDMDSVYNYLFSMLETTEPEEIPPPKEDKDPAPPKKVPKLRKQDKKRIKKQQKALERKMELENNQSYQVITETHQNPTNDTEPPQIESLSI